MKTLIEKDIARQLDILDYLLSLDDWIRLNEISDLCHVSPKTITQDMKELEQVLIIERSGAKGIRLGTMSAEKILEAQANLIQRSKIVSLLGSFFYYPEQKLIYYAEKSNMSLSALYKILHQLPPFLARYSLFIKKEGTKYSIEGKTETHYRRFFVQYFLEVYYEDVRMMVLENNQYIWKHGQLLEETLDLTKYSVLSTLDATSIYVTLIREYQLLIGNNLPNNLCAIRPARELLLSLSKSERNILLNALKSRSQVNKEKQALSKQEQEKLHFFIQEWMTRLAPESLSMKKDLYKILEQLIKSEKNISMPHIIWIDRYYYLTMIERQEHPALWDDIVLMIEDLSTLLRIDMNPNKHFLFLIIRRYFYEKIINRERSTIYVFSDISEEHAAFLSYVIKQHINVMYDMVPLRKREEVTHELLEEEVLITTDHRLSGKRVITVNDFPSERNIKTLKEYL